MASDKGITCDMSNVEFIGHVRERCHLTIKNTNAGPYVEELCGRLMMSSAEWSRLRAENERLREALEAIAKRGGGRGPSAAVVVDAGTLAKIAEQALKAGGDDKSEGRLGGRDWEN